MASPERKLLEKSGLRGIVFKGKIETEMVHLEGILAALRAMATDKLDVLAVLYELMTGKAFEGAETELMKGNIVFEMRPIERFDGILDLKARLWRYMETSA